jgi:hypothetical protein
MGGSEGEGSREYWLQVLVFRFSRHYLIDKSRKDGVVDVRRNGDMIILVKLVVENLFLNNY